MWMEEYGLPSECDPYGNSLCLKVLANGDGSAEWMVSVAERDGWEITVAEPPDENSLAGCIEVGCTALCEEPRGRLDITVINGPSFDDHSHMGCIEVGCTPLCAPIFDPLRCLIESAAPAHMQLRFILA